MAGKIETLDLRPMPPFERHEKIFQVWDGLKAGETLKIINDHDPRCGAGHQKSSTRSKESDGGLEKVVNYEPRTFFEFK